MGAIDIISKITSRVAGFSTLPTVAMRLLTLVGEERHSLKDLVNVIETDAAFTTRVLRVANSAMYARGREITTVNRAVAHLGEIMVVSIAVGSCTGKILGQALEGYSSAAGELWDHSLRTAIAARNIAAYSKTPVNPELAFTGGLLHDIGKSILSEFLAGRVEEVIDLYRQGEEIDYLKAEFDLIGTDHTQVGFTLAQHWRLPDPLPVCIRDHHYPSQSPDNLKPLVYVVHMADLVSMMAGSGTGADTLSYKLDPDLPQFITMKKPNFAKLLFDIHEEFQTARASTLNPEEKANG